MAPYNIKKVYVRAQNLAIASINLYYQGSTFRGSYFAKSIHKLVLQENVFNSPFFEMKVLLECPKAGVRGKISQILP